MHYRANPLPIYFPTSFEGQGHIIEKSTLAQRLWAYPNVYVQSFRSLALLLHAERENLLKTPRSSLNFKFYFSLPYSKYMLQAREEFVDNRAEFIEEKRNSVLLKLQITTVIKKAHYVTYLCFFLKIPYIFQILSGSTETETGTNNKLE